MAPAHPPTPEKNGDVLFAVRSAICHRLADDPGAGLELPEHLAGPARRPP